MSATAAQAGDVWYDVTGIGLHNPHTYERGTRSRPKAPVDAKAQGSETKATAGTEAEDVGGGRGEPGQRTAQETREQAEVSTADAPVARYDAQRY